MAYVAITNGEVLEGAPLDQSLLTKVKNNFEALKVTTDIHDADLDTAFTTLGTHASDINNNTNEIDDLKTQEAWINPPLTGGWAYYEPAQGSHPGLGYYKDEMGTVHLRGMIKGPTSSIFATLPAGYRPSKYLILIAWAAAAACRIDIDTNGSMLHNGGGVATSWVSLAGISFRAE